MSADAAAWFCEHFEQLQRRAERSGLAAEVAALAATIEDGGAVTVAQIRDLSRTLGGPEPELRYAPPIPGVEDGEPPRVEYQCPPPPLHPRRPPHTRRAGPRLRSGPRTDDRAGGTRMTALLTELGKRVAEKWLALLVLPGLVYVAVIAAGWLLSTHGWATDRQRDALADTVDRWASTASASTARVAVLLAVVLLFSATAGGMAQAAAAVIRRAWLAQWPFGQLIGFATRLRLRHWTSLDRRASDTRDAATRRRLIARRNQLAMSPPTQPTWMADRMAGLTSRVRNAYGLDLNAAWPRLWLILPDPVRTETRAAVDPFGRASVLAGWGVLYLPAGLVFAIQSWTLWWAIGLIALISYLAGLRRARDAIGELAVHLEAVVDLYGTMLAAALDPTAAPIAALTPPIGEVINERLRKGA